MDMKLDAANNFLVQLIGGDEDGLEEFLYLLCHWHSRCFEEHQIATIVWGHEIKLNFNQYRHEKIVEMLQDNLIVQHIERATIEKLDHRTDARRLVIVYRAAPATYEHQDINKLTVMLDLDYSESYSAAPIEYGTIDCAPDSEKTYLEFCLKYAA